MSDADTAGIFRHGKGQYSVSESQLRLREWELELGGGARHLLNTKEVKDWAVRLGEYFSIKIMIYFQYIRFRGKENGYRDLEADFAIGLQTICNICYIAFFFLSFTSVYHH